MKLIFLGPPGAGKGTQATRIAKELNIPHISTGDMLRTAIQMGTPMGLAAKAYMDKGDLVPDDVVIGVVKERLLKDDAQNGFLLDGFPRTVYQAEALDGFAQIGKVVLVDVNPEILIKRIAGRRLCQGCGLVFHTAEIGDATVCSTCGASLYQRPDDSEESVRNRLVVYQNQTAPLIDYYTQKGTLAKVDGSLPINEVNLAIRGVLGVANS